MTVLMTPVEDVLRRHQGDVHGHRGFLSAAFEFLPRAPLPLKLPADWSLWDEYIASIPDRYREGRLCEYLATLRALDPSGLPDAYLVRANMVLGALALGFRYGWQEMAEQGRAANGAARRCIAAAKDDVLQPIRSQIIAPWEAIWRRMGRHRSCVESDLFVANFTHPGDERYAPAAVNGRTSALLIPFFATRTEHRFWFSVIEICARFPGVSAAIELQQAMQRRDHQRVAAALARLASLWQEIVEDILASADTRVSAIEWGNTTARWTAALFDGEEGFSGLFAPAWHIMDQIVGRASYQSFLGQIMTRTRAMLPPAWQEFIAAVGALPVAAYVETHRRACSELDDAYRFLRQTYGYFFQSHRRKVFAFAYQAILSGRERTNAGIAGTDAAPGWELAHHHLRTSAAERPKAAPHQTPRAVRPLSRLSRHLLRLAMEEDGWLPGDRAQIQVDYADGSNATLCASLALATPATRDLPFWSTGFDHVMAIRRAVRLPGEFCRPPSDPAPVAIWADRHLAGMALAIAGSERSLAPMISLEAEPSLLDDLSGFAPAKARVAICEDAASRLRGESLGIHRFLEQGAHFYVLGRATFVRRMHAALREAVGLRTALVDDVFRRLREERRLHFCVERDSPAPRGEVSFWRWDIATATDPTRCVRVVLHGKVLNLTQFLAIHLGGDAILRMLAGTDITREFEIAHHAESSILGMPDVFFEGVCAPVPEPLQPFAAFIYKIVRFTNAFVATNNDIMQNSGAAAYVQANGLLQTLQLWPQPAMWGAELGSFLSGAPGALRALDDFCTANHQRIIDAIGRAMAEDREMPALAPRFNAIISAYEHYGRSLTVRLSEVLRQAYVAGDNDAIDRIGSIAAAELIPLAKACFAGLASHRPGGDAC